MFKIHKLTMSFPVQTFVVPPTAEYIHVGEQEQKVVVWFRFNSKNNMPHVDVQLTAVGTGHEFNHDVGDFQGTVVMQSGLVWHIFSKRI